MFKILSDRPSLTDYVKIFHVTAYGLNSLSSSLRLPPCQNARPSLVDDTIHRLMRHFRALTMINGALTARYRSSGFHKDALRVCIIELVYNREFRGTEIGIAGA